MKRAGRMTRVWIGLALVILGVLFLLDNLTPWHFPGEALWPVVLIVVGLMNILRRGSAGWFGGALVIFGVLFLLDALGVLMLQARDVWRFWPVILLIVGARILVGSRKARARRARRRGGSTGSDTGQPEAGYIFGGGEQRVTSRSFSDGATTTLFGSARIDLRQASLADGHATIDLTILFGSAELRVPGGWTIDVESFQLFGGVEDKRSQPGRRADGERLTITGFCMFGSITIID